MNDSTLSRQPFVNGDTLSPSDGSIDVVLGALDGFVVRDGIPIPATARVSGLLTGGAGGLHGEFYERDDPPLIIDSLAFADEVIASSTPTASFVARSLDYPAGGQDTLFLPDTDEYLGRDAASLRPGAAGNEQASPSVWRYSGFIEIDESMDLFAGNGSIDIEFGVGSDDGSRLTIGGVDVVTVDTLAIVTFPGVTGLASFEAPGLYPIEIVHYDHFGGIGLEVSSSIPGGGDAGGPGDTVGILPSDIVFRTVVPDLGGVLPPLIEHRQLPDGLINGVDPARFVIGADGDATITFLEENGAFASALGAYLIDDDGTITSPTIVFERMVTDDGHASIASGDAVQLSDLFDADELLPGREFGLFLVADGANGNLDDLGATGMLAFKGGTDPAKVTDRVPELIHIDPRGHVSEIDGQVMHTVDAGSPNPLSNKLNPGGSGQVVSGLQDGQYVVAFEDKPYDRAGSDDDFNDILVAVDNGSLGSVAEFSFLTATKTRIDDEARDTAFEVSYDAGVQALREIVIDLSTAPHDLRFDARTPIRVPLDLLQGLDGNELDLDLQADDTRLEIEFEDGAFEPGDAFTILIDIDAGPRGPDISIFGELEDGSTSGSIFVGSDALAIANLVIAPTYDGVV